MLECGHPDTCAREKEDEQVCAWCDEIVSLRSRLRTAEDEIGTLQEAIEQRAYVIKDGELHVERAEPVGYVAVFGGGRAVVQSSVKHLVNIGGRVDFQPEPGRERTIIDLPVDRDGRHPN